METIKNYWTALTWDKRKMRDLQGWTIVVIGATDGVGYCAAKSFAEHNAHVVLVGRNEEKCQKCVCQAAVMHIGRCLYSKVL